MGDIYLAASLPYYWDWYWLLPLHVKHCVADSSALVLPTFWTGETRFLCHKQPNHMLKGLYSIYFSRFNMNRLIRFIDLSIPFINIGLSLNVIMPRSHTPAIRSFKGCLNCWLLHVSVRTIDQLIHDISPGSPFVGV